jgi:hypothetical protein
MPETLQPPVPDHLPFFITPPGQTDVLMNVMIGIVLGIIILIGVFYLKLHALPERMAHRRNKVQLEIVALLTLLALFTHNNFFWIAALLLAMVQLPDLSGMLGSMARSLERMANARAPSSTEVAAARDLRIAAQPEPPPAPERTAAADHPAEREEKRPEAAGVGEGKTA